MFYYSESLCSLIYFISHSAKDDQRVQYELAFKWLYSIDNSIDKKVHMWLITATTVPQL